MAKIQKIMVLGYLFISATLAFAYYNTQQEVAETAPAWSEAEAYEEILQEETLSEEEIELELLSTSTIAPELTDVAGTLTPGPSRVPTAIPEKAPTDVPEFSEPAPGPTDAPEVCKPTPVLDATVPPKPSESPSAGESGTKDTEGKVEYNGKVIRYVNTSYRMKDETMKQIVKMVKDAPYYSSFVLYDIKTGATICYNENRYYPVASTVKAPFVLSCLQQVEEGEFSLEDTMEYTKEYKVSGDGVIKKSDMGKLYTVKELMEHAILVSDDIGYLMLQGFFGFQEYNSFLKGLGNKVTIDGIVKWGKTSAMDSMRNWKEIYKYIHSDSEYASFFGELLQNTNKSFIRNVLGDEYQIYNKMGWVKNQCCHDQAIVMDDSPYLMVIMTLGNVGKENQKFMETLAEILDGVHEELVSKEMK